MKNTFATLTAIATDNEILASYTATLTSLKQVSEIAQQLYYQLASSLKPNCSLYFTISQEDQVKYKLSSQDTRIERILWYFQNYPIKLTPNPTMNVLVTIKDKPDILKREDLINLILEYNSYPEDWIYPENFEYDPSKGPAIIWIIHDDSQVYFEYQELPEQEDLDDYIIYQNNGLTIIEDC